MLAAASVRAFSVPSAARIVTPLDLPQVMGAVVLLVRSRPLSTSVTPVTPFFTLTEPSEQVPEST